MCVLDDLWELRTVVHILLYHFFSEARMKLPDKVPPTVDVNDIPGPDFTTYLELGGTRDKYSQEGSFLIRQGKTTKLGRGLKCSAYRGKYWSITLRCGAPRLSQQSMTSYLREYIQQHPPEKYEPQEYLGYCPEGHDGYLNLFTGLDPLPNNQAAESKGEVVLNDIYNVCKLLHTIVKPTGHVTPTGLITLTGATNSAKSLIARGLVFLFLQAAAEDAEKKNLRRPHLVTFEDPIEKYYIKDPATNLAPANRKELENLLAALYIDYTPRERKTDADKLSRVIKDAKRQTPTIFFVGETRDPKDWKELLDFGGSGHFVITTSHAGSVVEAMTQIFRSTKTQSASQRSEIAHRIRAVINIRPFTVISNTSTIQVLLPAVWKSTSQSINNLVADGLSSILPALGREEELGYFGRTYFAEQLLERSTCKDKVALRDKILRQARQWDIEGV